MNARLLQGLAAALLALLGGLLVWWWLQNFELVEQTRYAPPRGEASYNPLYALGRTLERLGRPVLARASLDLNAMDLRASDTLVLATEWSHLAAEEESALVQWVQSGGALVFRLPRADNSDKDSHLLEWTGMSLHEVDSRCTDFRVEAVGGEGQKARETRSYAYCTTRGFSLDPAVHPSRFDLLLPAEGEQRGVYVMGRSRSGKGQWFAGGTLGFLGNTQLQNPAAAELAWQVLRPMLRDGGRVHLVYGVDMPPLHVLLLRHGWPVLLPLLAALLAWLWLRSLRFGPLVPEPAAARQALREHVAAAGAFAFHGGAARALLDPLRRACLGRLRRTDPELAALDGEDLVRAVAARTGHSRERLRRALLPDRDLQHPERFRRAVRLLAQLIHDS